MPVLALFVFFLPMSGAGFFGLRAGGPMFTLYLVLVNLPFGIITALAADANDLLVIDLARGGRVVIALADAFAPVHVANIRALARAHWYDGLVIERVQDNYVTQCGNHRIRRCSR